MYSKAVSLYTQYCCQKWWIKGITFHKHWAQIKYSNRINTGSIRPCLKRSTFSINSIRKGCFYFCQVWTSGWEPSHIFFELCVKFLFFSKKKLKLILYLFCALYFVLLPSQDKLEQFTVVKIEKEMENSKIKFESHPARLRCSIIIERYINKRSFETLWDSCLKGYERATLV